MKETYDLAIAQVFKEEGGYTNDPHDPGGPTNFGITIHDARLYWKPNATAEDVQAMPKSVAEDIYRKHYADSIWYDQLPPGIDHAALDFAVNSGVIKFVKILQEIVNAPVDGIMGPNTLVAVDAAVPETVIGKIWDERLAYDQSLTSLWPIYGHGWTNRINRGRTLSMSLLTQFINLFKKEIPMAGTPAPQLPTIQFDPATFVTDVEQALEAANTLLPALLPVIGAFYPPAAAFAKFLPLLPVVLNAVQTVQTQLNNPQASVTAVANHLTPGQSNSPALSTPMAGS